MTYNFKIGWIGTGDRGNPVSLFVFGGWFRP